MHTHKDIKMPRLILFLKIVISTFKENYTDNFNFFNQYFSFIIYGRIIIIFDLTPDIFFFLQIAALSYTLLYLDSH